MAQSDVVRVLTNNNNVPMKSAEIAMKTQTAQSSISSNLAKMKKNGELCSIETYEPTPVKGGFTARKLTIRWALTDYLYKK